MNTWSLIKSHKHSLGATYRKIQAYAYNPAQNLTPNWPSASTVNWTHCARWKRQWGLFLNSLAQQKTFWTEHQQHRLYKQQLINETSKNGNLLYDKEHQSFRQSSSVQIEIRSLPTIHLIDG